MGYTDKETYKAEDRLSVATNFVDEIIEAIQSDPAHANALLFSIAPLVRRVVTGKRLGSFIGFGESKRRGQDFYSFSISMDGYFAKWATQQGQGFSRFYELDSSTGKKRQIRDWTKYDEVTNQDIVLFLKAFLDPRLTGAKSDKFRYKIAKRLATAIKSSAGMGYR